MTAEQAAILDRWIADAMRLRQEAERTGRESSILCAQQALDEVLVNVEDVARRIEQREAA